MPGGTTRTTTYFDPYPLFIERGEGCRIWDVDGIERIHMLGNYTAMILGHAHPKVVEAIRKQAARGTGFAAANPLEVQLAELLCERAPSLDSVRFCNSGTEAAMFGMRLARAFTGRPKTARIEGGYHGTHDYAEVSTHPDVSEDVCQALAHGAGDGALLSKALWIYITSCDATAARRAKGQTAPAR